MAGTDLARAARELQPHKQGDLDGLCGLYAIINALRLVVYPDRVISTRTCEQLLDCGLAVLARKRKLREAVVYGIDNEPWLAMCHAVVAESIALLEIRTMLQPLIDADRAWHTRDVIRSIQRSIRCNRPVVICFEGRLEHYSVVTGYTASRLKLFDSAGCHWVCIRSLTTTAPRHGKPHLINRGGVLQLAI